METTEVTARQGPGADLGQLERMASAVLGGALLTLGLGRRSLGGTAVALASGGLLARGFTGRRGGLRALGAGLAGRGEQRGLRAQVAPAEVERVLTIGRPAEELHRLWRDPQALAAIMAHFAEVTPVDADRTHWKVRSPIGRSLEWDARIVEERPGELLRWESLEGAELPSEGTLSFRRAPGDWGTEASLWMRFRPPGGALGAALMKRLQLVPRVLAQRSLRRFKSLAETGEIPTTERNPSARRGAQAD